MSAGRARVSAPYVAYRGRRRVRVVEPWVVRPSVFKRGFKHVDVAIDVGKVGGAAVHAEQLTFGRA